MMVGKLWSRGSCFQNRHGSDADDYRTPRRRTISQITRIPIRETAILLLLIVSARARARAYLRIYLGTCDFKLQRPPSAAFDTLPRRYVIPRCTAPYVPDRSPRSISASSAISWTRVVNGDGNRQFVNLPNGNHHRTKVEGRVCAKNGTLIRWKRDIHRLARYLTTVGKVGIALIDFCSLPAEGRCDRSMMARSSQVGGRSCLHCLQFRIIYWHADVFDIFHRSSSSLRFLLSRGVLISLFCSHL